MSYTDRVIKTRSEYIRLFTSKIDGEDAWFIVQIDKDKMDKYLHDVKSGRPIDLPDYGKVLYRDWGKEPPAELVNQLREKYAA